MKSFDEWMSTIGINAFRHANCCKIAYEAGQQSRQAEIDELKQEVKKWKAQSIMSVIHGTCDCGEPWQVVVSNKEGFNQLHCFACGKDRYENKDFFGEESARKSTQRW